MDQFLAEIRMFAGNFAPRGWAFCEGQLLRVSDHSALFSLLGNTYGGDGRSTFALPDLSGRAAIHPSWRGEIRLGQVGGGEPVVAGKVNEDEEADEEQSTVNRQPFVAVNFIIAVEGIFPSRG